MNTVFKIVYVSVEIYELQLSFFIYAKVNFAALAVMNPCGFII